MSPQDLILHVDADAFFASCEQAIHPELRGKPVITGAERGIVSAVSYEAKRRGVSRGTPLWEVKRIIPEAVILPSDHETYSIFSERIFSILRTKALHVEEYSIDEAFARIAVPPEHACEYARTIQRSMYRSLGITVSIGIARTKVLAKLASSFKKPAGVCFFAPEDISAIGSSLSVGALWGVGRATTEKLECRGVATVRHFFDLAFQEVRQEFSRPIQDIWRELHGESVMQFISTETSPRHSIQKVRTFSSPSNDRQRIFAHLLCNLENACTKARRYHVRAGRIGIILRKQDFRFQYADERFAYASNTPMEFHAATERLFEQLFLQSFFYRSTGIVLSELLGGRQRQKMLFQEENLRAVRVKALYTHIDKLDRKFGKHTVYSAGLLGINDRHHEGERGGKNGRTQNVLKGETVRKRLALPFFHVVV